ncbi:MAG TPA: hypothetical protein VJ180_16355 [Pyrinomonadaceae bacterium]|nr:hypothetical protein [Pyrinomonadaceae bacterium]
MSPQPISPQATFAIYFLISGSPFSPRREPERAAALKALEEELVRLYYLGLIAAYAQRIAEVPSR